MNKECKHCPFEDVGCAIKYLEYEQFLLDKCPCITCLVKSMCEDKCVDRIRVYVNFQKGGTFSNEK